MITTALSSCVLASPLLRLPSISHLRLPRRATVLTLRSTNAHWSPPPTHSYLRDHWNALDASLVGLSWLTFALNDISALKSLRTLRLLRVLRVLRTINKFPGLKLVVTAMMQSVGPMLNVIPVVMMFFLVFAIVATSYFKGALSACQGPVFESLSEAQIALITTPSTFTEARLRDLNITMVHPRLNPSEAAAGYSGKTSRDVCQWYGAAWEPVIPQSFDNVLYSMNAFVQVRLISSACAPHTSRQTERALFRAIALTDSTRPFFLSFSVLLFLPSPSFLSVLLFRPCFPFFRPFFLSSFPPPFPAPSPLR